MKNTQKAIKMLCRQVICVLPIFMFGRQNVLAGQQDFQSAGSGSAFLDIGIGARAAGMGEAFAGIADDATSIYWNPAGLGQMKNMQVMVMHNQWFQDVMFEYGAVAIPLAKEAGLGFSAVYVNYGAIERLDEYGQEQGEFTAYDLNISAAYGMELTANFLAGAGVKMPISVIDSESYISYAADAGILYKVSGWEPLRIGVMLKNMGTRMPSQVKVGIGIVEAIAGLKAGMDIGTGLYEEGVQVNMGAEYMIMGVVSPRIGYKITSNENGWGGELAGLTAGIGASLQSDGFTLGMDYAYVPYGDLGDTHRVSLMMEFVGPTASAKDSMATGYQSPGLKASDWGSPESYGGQSYRNPEPTMKQVKKKPLLPPGKIIVKKAGARIKVRWTSSPSAQRYGYNVYMKKGAKGKFYKVKKQILRKNSYTSKKLTRKSTYYFMVKTVDSQGATSRGAVSRGLYLK